VAAVAACVFPTDHRNATALKELTPTGQLRVGVAVAPARSALFVVRDTNGKLSGVTVDLGTALANKLGVPVEFIEAHNSGELTDALASGSGVVQRALDNAGVAP
jgi:polar amino acid transport system substrate-binding protein